MTIRESIWPTGTPCWVDIAVPDVAEAMMFYRSVLGWSYVDTGPELNHYTVCRTFRRDAAAIGPAPSTTQPSAWTVYLASDDADTTAKLVVENGGTLVVEPADVGDNGRMCVALDPCGGMFGVWQAIETIGVEIIDEPGALVWTDARLTEPAVGMEFYAACSATTTSRCPGLSMATARSRSVAAPPGDGRDVRVDRGAVALARVLRGGRRGRRGRRREVVGGHRPASRPGHPVRPDRPAGATGSARPSACTVPRSARRRARGCSASCPIRSRAAGSARSARPAHPAGTRTSRTAGRSWPRPATTPRHAGALPRPRRYHQLRPLPASRSDPSTGSVTDPSGCSSSIRSGDPA